MEEGNLVLGEEVTGGWTLGSWERVIWPSDYSLPDLLHFFSSRQLDQDPPKPHGTRIYKTEVEKGVRGELEAVSLPWGLGSPEP